MAGRSDREETAVLPFRDEGLARLRRLLRTHSGVVDLHERRETLGVRERLDAYVEGAFAAFGDLALATNGTPFQKAVWSA